MLLRLFIFVLLERLNNLQCFSTWSHLWRILPCFLFPVLDLVTSRLPRNCWVLIFAMDPSSAEPPSALQYTEFPWLDVSWEALDQGIAIQLSLIFGPLP